MRAMAEHRSFATSEELERWLEAHHATETELWVRIYKKGAGTPSVTWEDCVVASIAWGWIDGLKRSLDEASYLQRLTPRRARSGWSKKNCGHAERLIAEGRMRPSGLAHVEAARSDGRWEAAYAGSATMVFPDEFLTALAKNRAAQRFFDALDRTNLFAIYHRVQTAKKPETRARRIETIVAKLARGERYH